MADRRILIVSHTGNYPLDVGGPQAVSYHVSLYLAKEGFEVTLYQRFKSTTHQEAWASTPEASLLSQAGVNTLSLIADYSLKNLWRYPLYIYRAPRRLDGANYDIIHYNSPPVDANVLLPYKYVKKCAQTVAIHGGLFYESKNIVGRRIFRSTVKHMRVAIALNSFSKRIALDQGFPQERVVTIPNGVDTSTVDSIQPKTLAGNPSIVYAGRLEAVKGVETLVAAAHTLKNKLPHFRLYIAGSGSMENYLRNQARLLSPHITFLGRLPTARDVIGLFKGANLVVIPSIKENFSISLLEAMASGTPIIASDAEGNMDVVSHQNAWIFKRGSTQSLTQTILEAAADVENSKRKALQARLEVEQKYEWSKIIRKYVELFEKLLEAQT
ncbi:MAG: glycosyltransferase family 4 protein [Thermoprotei archaeon]